MLICSKPSLIGILGLQTDDTLFLGNTEFANLEDSELKKAKIIAKQLEKLSEGNPLIFNGYKLTLDGKDIRLSRKEQADRLQSVELSGDSKRAFQEQRARGAYLATICQPEAALLLSVAVQHQNPGKAKIAALNKQLKWQMENKSRGLIFKPLNLESANLYVFIDGAFANNKDFSSQIGFIIVLGNESVKENEFTMVGNIIHWSSIKCKRITRCVLASELLAMVHGVDSAIALGTTLEIITRQIGISKILTIVCTDSFSLYEYLVKLGTTKEKRLMIDIMSIRQSYEKREPFEIRWFSGDDNPADAMIKVNASKALKRLDGENKLTIKVDGWVQRE